VSLAVIAGSGLAGIASILDVTGTIPFEQIPGVVAISMKVNTTRWRG